MSENLDTMSDAELNELFAVEIAGWTIKRFWPSCDMRTDTSKPCHQWYRPDGSLYSSDPWFCTDANAVLPWLAKMNSASAVLRTWIATPDWCVTIKECVGENGERLEAQGVAPTFARAAVLALIRINRATK